jgi:hypothetical protein
MKGWLGARAGLNIVEKRKLRATDSVEYETGSGRCLNMLSEQKGKGKSFRAYSGNSNLRRTFQHAEAGWSGLFQGPRERADPPPPMLRQYRAGVVVNKRKRKAEAPAKARASGERSTGRSSGRHPGWAGWRGSIVRQGTPSRWQAPSNELDSSNLDGSMEPAASCPASGSGTGSGSSLLTWANEEALNEFDQTYPVSTETIR